MTFKLDWRAMEETLIENAAAEMIRFNVARRCGEAFIERIKERLTEDNVGADGRPVLTGGLRTGQMWRGFKIKPGGQGARGYFAGSSFNSRYYETEIQKKPDRDLIEFEKTLSQKEKIIRKRTAAKKGAPSPLEPQPRRCAPLQIRESRMQQCYESHTTSLVYVLRRQRKDMREPGNAL